MSKTAKPDRQQAMLMLIQEARTNIPFGLSEAQMCSGICHGCSKKMLTFLETELDSWEYRVGQGEIPSFGDLQKLGKMSGKIYRALEKSGLVAAD